MPSLDPIEYKIEDIPLHSDNAVTKLNELGKDGWELIHVIAALTDHFPGAASRCLFLRHVPA